VNCGEFHVKQSIAEEYDVVVAGAGHAGIEASLAASRMGSRVALVTMDRGAIGRMSCNPAIGGTAKGHLVREVDALGGEMGHLADQTGIHFRMLNKSKGPAVWSPRSQNDREWYSRAAAGSICGEPGLDVVEGSIVDISLNKGRLAGIIMQDGRHISCRALILCSGTFLNAIMHTGLNSTPGGRFGEAASIGLSARLESLGFLKGRLKTGTPPRVRRSSIDFASTEEQPGDDPPTPFSHRTESVRNVQIPMYLTYTNQRTHDILRKGFDDSPMFSGRIKGVGPRYCPSIEDKIDRFGDRERHQIYLEPEGYESDIVYVNGFSTSLPGHIQEEAIRTIPGMEKCEVLRYGYAVEYDFFPPHQLEHSLESKLQKGLFLAGQINGTSGYEEAAAQGIMAGINAVLSIRGNDPVVLGRSDAYIGVLVDDLINKGTIEPYRIFTSRAEYRLQLRQDNADSRLMRTGNSLGLVPGNAIDGLTRREAAISRAKVSLANVRAKPDDINSWLEAIGSASIDDSAPLDQLLKRSEVELTDLAKVCRERGIEFPHQDLEDKRVLERVQIEVKYEGYLRRQQEQIAQFKIHESMEIPRETDYSRLKSLSTEGLEKLMLVRPRSIGQAARISGITPADITVLMIHLRN
jgi:tRNA uridine 5-carboxymethylaminomethyl modification enzyme